MTFDSILRIKELSPRKFTVSGTPADCVFTAIGEILKDKRPDLVLSGINHGSNVADFIGLSGTVGAAFAAVSQDIKAVAISQDCAKCGEPVKFPIADHFLSKIIKKLLSFQWPERVCMNVNFPDASVGDISGIKIVGQGNFDVKWNIHKRSNPSGNPYYWLQASHTDVSECDTADSLLLSKKKYITIGALRCRQDFCGCRDKLEELFSSNV